MHTNKKRVGYLSPIIAAAAGAVVGAVVMSNKKNQDKVKNVVADIKKKVEAKKFETEIKAQKLSNIAKDTVEDVKNI